MSRITDKQKKFVDEYLIDLNATQAAIRAGYSPRTAQEQSARLLSNVMVSEAIEKAQAAQSRRTGITADRVIRELARIAFVNAPDVIDPESATVHPSAERDDLAAIQSIKVKRSESETGSSEEHEVKLCDKLRALELLGKHLGMFGDTNQTDSATLDKLDKILEEVRADAADSETEDLHSEGK